MRNRFHEKLANWSNVIKIRGQGLMLGIELPIACGELVKEALAAKLLINVTSERVVRLLPALVITQVEAEQIVDKTSSLIDRFLTTQYNNTTPT